MFNLIFAILFSLATWAATGITITQGDTPTLALQAATGAGANFDLTGATFQTQIRGPAGVIKTFGNSQHTGDPDQTANKGKYTLLLSATDTAALAVASGLEMVTKVTQGSTITFFHAKKILTVQAAQPDPL